MIFCYFIILSLICIYFAITKTNNYHYIKEYLLKYIMVIIYFSIIFLICIYFLIKKTQFYIKKFRLRYYNIDSDDEELLKDY